MERNEHQIKEKRIFLKECYLLNTNKYDLLFIEDRDIKKDDINLTYEDKKVLAVLGSDYTIGEVPKEEAVVICELLKMNWEECFTCRVANFDVNANENRRVSIAIFVKEKKKEK